MSDGKDVEAQARPTTDNSSVAWRRPSEKLTEPVRPVFGTPIATAPAIDATVAGKSQTYIAEAIARDPLTGSEKRANVIVEAPPGSAIKLRRGSSVVNNADGELPRNYNTGAELELVVTSIGIRKTHYPIDKVIFLGVLAGIWVAFAGMFAQQVVGGVPPDIRAAWPVLPKLLISVTFPIGIVFIIMFGGELFTGNTMILMVAWLNKKVSAREVLTNWFLVFWSNFLACALTAYLFGYLTRLFEAEPFHSYVVSVANKKANYAFHQAFLLAIPANALVCLAVFLGLAARDLTGKVIGLYLPIATFAATGYEHVVANMYFLSLGAMLGAESVTAGRFALNLLAVGLGNIVGGALLIGCSEYYMYHWHRHEEPTKHTKGAGKWGRLSEMDLH